MHRLFLSPRGLPRLSLWHELPRLQLWLCRCAAPPPRRPSRGRAPGSRDLRCVPGPPRNRRVLDPAGERVRTAQGPATPCRGPRDVAAATPDPDRHRRSCPGDFRFSCGAPRRTDPVSVGAPAPAARRSELLVRYTNAPRNRSAALVASNPPTVTMGVATARTRVLSAPVPRPAIAALAAPAVAPARPMWLRAPFLTPAGGPARERWGGGGSSDHPGRHGSGHRGRAGRCAHRRISAPLTSRQVAVPQRVGPSRILTR